MKSRDFKARAKEALKGKWFVAIIASFIASMFGVGGGSFSISVPAVDPSETENLKSWNFDVKDGGIVFHGFVIHITDLLLFRHAFKHIFILSQCLGFE